MCRPVLRGGYVREFIRLADQKAAFLFAVGTGMLAFLNGTSVRDRWFQDPRTWSLPDFLAFLTVAGLSIAIMFAIFVVLPRRRGTRRGIIFFDAIAEASTARDFAEEVAQKDEAALARETLQHCHELSTICRSKYGALDFAIRAGSVGAGALVLYYLVTAQP